jgi:hypothetical protein
MSLEANADESQIQTVFGGVLCETPFQLRKAITAANRGESQRVWQLGCTRAGDGTKAILLDQIAPPFGPWQVQLMTNGGLPLPMWGYASSFKFNTDNNFSPVEVTPVDDPD